MTLMASRKPKTYRWDSGDLISATKACELLGYKSGRNLQDKRRREALLEEFNDLDCQLTLDIYIGGSQRFLRSEFDTFVTAKVEKAQGGRKRQNLRLAA